MPAARSAPVSSPAAARLGLGAGRLDASQPSGQTRGRTSGAEARAAIEMAATAGVRLIDAGARDGQIENILGHTVSSLKASAPPFSILVRAPAFTGDPAAVEAGARASLRRIGVERARALVVASGDLLRAEGQDLWKRLLKLKDAGLFEKIGVQVEAADDAVGLARRFKPDILQVCASLIDPRNILDGTLDRLAALGIEVHLGRVLQGGLLFHSGAPVPATAAQFAPRLSRLRRMIAEAGADPLQAALAFALRRPEAAFVIVGVSSAPELRAVIAAAASGAPDLDWAALAGAGPGELSAAA